MKKERMTKQELINEINIALVNKPSYLRKGEFIYNYIDETYNIADDVRLKDFVSCFFDNDYIDKFLECASKRIND